MPKILETDRLILRTWTIEDAPKLFEICSDECVMRFIGTGKPYQSLEEAEKFLQWATKFQEENGFCRWAVLLKENYEIIGSCGFARPFGIDEIELGYLLARKFWGKGFASEAAGACLKYGFEKLGFREIIAMTDLENAVSQKVLEKIGFIKRSVEIFNNEKSLVYLAKNSENI